MPIVFTKSQIRQQLEELGYEGLNDEQLGAFIYDLKKLIKTEEKKRQERKARAALQFVETPSFSSHSIEQEFSPASRKKEKPQVRKVGGKESHKTPPFSTHSIEHEVSPASASRKKKKPQERKSRVQGSPETSLSSQSMEQDAEVGPASRKKRKPQVRKVGVGSKDNFETPTFSSNSLEPEVSPPSRKNKPQERKEGAKESPEMRSLSSHSMEQINVSPASGTELKILKKVEEMKPQERKVRAKESTKFPSVSSDSIEQISSTSCTASMTTSSSSSENTAPVKRIKLPPQSVRHDPVALYHFYKSIWDKQKSPGEDLRMQLRWNVRAGTLGRIPCDPCGNPTNYLR